MDSTKQRMEVIFGAAIELTAPEQRKAFVVQACGNDHLLLMKVEALLQAYDQAGGFLTALPETPVPILSLETGAATISWPATEKPGDRIGRYKLLEKIGEGGCGVVYVAEQEQPIRRRVALKVIKLGMDTKNVIARFEAERQALALMDHPNIAQVYDAGATETGRPYFVMELVRGIKITNYCDQNKLSTRERLNLFIQVCRALQHAHQKGIIHRDIKPSNILVTHHDGVPVPKVIDFGIAKATTEQRLTDKTIYTAFEQFIGTPAYMSPEQAEMSGLDIDTRSDIYSLGVLLYELLTGKTPFDTGELMALGLDEMRRVIREKEPLKPSTRLTRELAAASGESGDPVTDPQHSTLARQRCNQIHDLIPLLRGDLDWIVMKALEKDRTRRYETANGLAQDIERHLQQEPVVARPPSAAYHLQKFVRRNQWMVAMGLTVTAALMLGAVISAWQAMRATRAEREQGYLRMKAEANERKALQAQEEEAKQRIAAVGARTLAEQERGFAQTNELLARQNAYAADIHIADIAWRDHNRGQALSALRRHIPKSGQTDLRGIEWRYLWHKSQGQQLTTLRHEAGVTCAELSPDGRWLATASGGAFWIWDRTREGERRVLASCDPAKSQALAQHIAFDPQGRFLATATLSEVVIWNLLDWRRLDSLPATNASLSFSGDGTRLATFGQEGIQIWDAGTWECVVSPGKINLGCRDFSRIALNRDGSLLAASSWNALSGTESHIEGKMALWKVPEYQLLFQRPDTIHAIKLAFSDDDRWLAVCTWGPPAMVWLWSVPECKLEAKWPVSQGLGRALAFATGGNILVTAGTDPSISLWKIGNTNRQGLLQGHLNVVCSLSFAANGLLVSAAMDNTVRLWDIKQARSSQPAFSLPPGRLIYPQTANVHRIASVNLADLTFEQWEVESGQCLRQVSIQGAHAILRGGKLLDGRSMTNGIYRDFFFMDRDVPPNSDRVKNMLPFVSFYGAEPPPWDLCASTGDGRFYAWSAESGELVYSNKLASSLIGILPVADYNKLILIENWEARFSCYDLKTRQIELLEEHGQINPTGMPISPNGHFFAYVATNGLVNVWNAITKQTKTIITLPALNHFQMAFSLDSQLLAGSTPDGWARVWKVHTGQPVSDPLLGHFPGTYKVSFSADSQSLVTYNWDFTAKIWNIATGREMISDQRLNWFLTSHPGWNLLPSDGNSVIESAGDRAIRIVRLPTLAQIDALEKEQMKTPGRADAK